MKNNGDHEGFKIMIKLFLKDVLTKDQIVIPLQSYIQKYGGLDENDETIKLFLKKFKGQTMTKQCENIGANDNQPDCSDYLNCCDCGTRDMQGCSCAYCWSCNACDYCYNGLDD